MLFTTRPKTLKGLSYQGYYATSYDATIAAPTSSALPKTVIEGSDTMDTGVETTTAVVTQAAPVLTPMERTPLGNQQHNDRVKKALKKRKKGAVKTSFTR